MIRGTLAALRRHISARDAAGLMTPEEVAVRLGVDVSVIHRRIAKGDIPSVRIGRALRIEPAALDRAIAIIIANYGPSA